MVFRSLTHAIWLPTSHKINDKVHRIYSWRRIQGNFHTSFRSSIRIHTKVQDCLLKDL